jgi:hypothetical protein
MSRYLINFLVFLAGLAVAAWIGAGYAGTNPLALAVTLLIGACYLAGAVELWRYQQATSSLTRALSGLSEAPGNLGTWLDRLAPSLRNAARLRIEGERAGLPGPALTPYLVGLLVLLGMLGTFLGMVVTLRGTGLALESATGCGPRNCWTARPRPPCACIRRPTSAKNPSSCCSGRPKSCSARPRPCPPWSTNCRP